MIFLGDIPLSTLIVDMVDSVFSVGIYLVDILDLSHSRLDGSRMKETEDNRRWSPRASDRPRPSSAADNKIVNVNSQPPDDDVSLITPSTPLQLIFFIE